MFNNSKSGTTQYAGYDKRFAQPERSFVEGKLLDAGKANVISIGAADTAIIQAVGEGSFVLQGRLTNASPWVNIPMLEKGSLAKVGATGTGDTIYEADVRYLSDIRVDPDATDVNTVIVKLEHFD